MKKLGSRHENLDLKVYRELKSMIVDRKLKPGDKILQEKISREFGVSRTPLMCALKKLSRKTGPGRTPQGILRAPLHHGRGPRGL